MFGRLPGSRRRALAVAAFLALIGCVDGGGRRDDVAVAQAFAELRPFCLGRYDFGIPATARLRGRDQWVEHMHVAARAAEPGATLDGLADEIDARPRENAMPPVPAESRERVGDDTLLLTTRETLYDLTTVDTVAVRLAGGSVFEASGQHTTAEGIAAQRAVAVGIVEAIVPTLDPAPGSGRFCLDRGVMERPFAWQESAQAGFDLGPDVHLYVSIISNGQAVGESLLDRTPGVLARIAGLGIGMDTLRSGRRPLAGHDGEELLIAREGGRDMLFQWHYVGEPVSGDDPSIEFRLEAADVADRDALIATWDAILASLRRRPDA